MGIGFPPPKLTNLDLAAAMDSNTVLCAELTDNEIMHQIHALPQSTSDSDENTLDRLQPALQDIAVALALYNVYEENMTLTEMQSDIPYKRGI